MKVFDKNNFLWKILIAVFFVFIFSGFVQADIIVNVLAVNGTSQEKEKEIKHVLPKELIAEDIIDSAGLKVDYDVNLDAYFVHGVVQLAPKETKTFKVKIRDLWKIDQKTIEDIKEQLDLSLERLKNTEYYDTGVIKKKSLVDRLDFVVNEQEKYSDNVQKRIDTFRVYADEIKTIRSNALSVAYWRSRLPSQDARNLIKFVVTLENPSKLQPVTSERRVYLPQEVRPEHIVDAQGFDTRYDAFKKQNYFYKEYTLQPAEVKRLEFQILDVWNIDQKIIEDYKDRTRKAYKLLEKTQYFESAGYLVANIKKLLDSIERSQSVEKEIKEHISAYRVNQNRLDLAKKDVETLENLLEAIRENLERSRLKNIVERIRSLKKIQDIAKVIFGTKIFQDNTWKIITGIMIFVGILTAIHFALWGRRSSNLRDEDFEDVEGESQKEKDSQE